MIGAALALPGAAAAQPAPTETARRFRLGLTPHPFDFNEAAFAKTYELILAHGDIVGHHLDEGVPWTEALSGAPFPDNVEQDLARRRNSTPPGTNIFLSMTPLAISRDAMAGRWGSDSHMPLPPAFAGKALNDPVVVLAYTNYCRRLIQLFQPTHAAYAIEITPLTEKPAVAAQFIDLARQVYTTLKAEFPAVKLFPTYVLGNAAALNAPHRALVRDLLPFTDVLAVSTYPYVWDGVGGSAARIPADWFTKFAALAPSKPFAVAETGFLAGNFIYALRGVAILAGPADQAAYVRRLLADAQALRAEFVIWYVPVDYDRLWALMQAQGTTEWFRQWMRTGLWTAALEPRPSLAIWDAWRRLPYQPGTAP